MVSYTVLGLALPEPPSPERFDRFWGSSALALLLRQGAARNRVNLNHDLLYSQLPECCFSRWTPDTWLQSLSHLCEGAVRGCLGAGCSCCIRQLTHSASALQGSQPVKLLKFRWTGLYMQRCTVLYIMRFVKIFRFPELCVNLSVPSVFRYAHALTVPCCSG